MSTSILKSYTKEELKNFLQEATSLTDFLFLLGYNAYSGSVVKTAKEYFKEIGLEEEYKQIAPIKRNPDNIFIVNSTASQKVLRKYYKRGNYTPYVCSICGQQPEWNGKPLTLILDHINGNNKDDRLENLRWVCPNCNQQLPTTGSKNRQKIERNHCPDCGKIISQKSHYCSSCAGKHTSKEIIENIISREELKKELRNKTLDSIGKKYGKTSGNAVKKWCDYYGLPRLKRDIKNYSDEEWELI